MPTSTSTRSVLSMCALLVLAGIQGGLQYVCLQPLMLESISQTRLHADKHASTMQSRNPIQVHIHNQLVKAQLGAFQLAMLFVQDSFGPNNVLCSIIFTVNQRMQDRTEACRAKHISCVPESRTFSGLDAVSCPCSSAARRLGSMTRTSSVCSTASGSCRVCLQVARPLYCKYSAQSAATRHGASK